MYDNVTDPSHHTEQEVHGSFVSETYKSYSRSLFYSPARRLEWTLDVRLSAPKVPPLPHRRIKARPTVPEFIQHPATTSQSPYQPHQPHQICLTLSKSTSPATILLPSRLQVTTSVLQSSSTANTTSSGKVTSNSVFY